MAIPEIADSGRGTAIVGAPGKLDFLSRSKEGSPGMRSLVMRCLCGRRGSAIAAAAILVVALLPGSAFAAGTTSAVMYSEPDDYIGIGRSYLFHPGNANFAVTGNANYLTVSVDDGTFGGDWFSFVFAGPDNEALAPGIYENAQRAPFRDPGHPGIDISGSGRGCDPVGRFEVKDLAVDAVGVPERLWIVFEQRCPNRGGRLFGEVRVAVPPRSAAQAMPGVVRWPTSYHGRPGLTVPVTVLANAPVTLISAYTIGQDATSFPISTDECTGRTLAVGESCKVWIGFDPATPGERSANLRLVDTTAVTYDVVLRGRAAEPSVPTDLVVDQSDGFVTASWILPAEPPDMLTGYLEFAPDPETDADGFFTHPDTIAYLFDSRDTAFDSYPDQFPPGTYYVHVSAYGATLCYRVNFCLDVFSSPPVKLVVPPDPAPPPEPTTSPPGGPTTSAPTGPTPQTLLPPAAKAAPADTVASVSISKTPSKQRVGNLFIEAMMREPGTLSATATVSVPNATKLYRFKTVSARASPGAKVKLRLKLAKRALKAVKTALKRGRKVAAKVTITATDKAGNKKIAKRRIKLKL